MLIPFCKSHLASGSLFIFKCHIVQDQLYAGLKSFCAKGLGVPLLLVLLFLVPSGFKEMAFLQLQLRTDLQRTRDVSLCICLLTALFTSLNEMRCITRVLRWPRRQNEQTSTLAV